MSENKPQPPAYTLYFSLHCPNCQKFLKAIQPLPTAKSINYWDVQRKKRPSSVQFVPCLVDNKSGVQYVGSQAFDLLKLWLQGEQLSAYAPFGTGAQEFANLDDGLVDQGGAFTSLV